MNHLATLPNEVLHHILKDVNVADCAHVSLTCKSLHKFIADNKPLFKDIFNRKLDALPEGQTNHEEELKRMFELERILKFESFEAKLPHINSVVETTDHFLKLASRNADIPSQTFEFLTSHFEETTNQEAFLCQSTIFNRARLSRATAPSTNTFAQRQASAKLHCLYGVPILLPKRTHFSSIYPLACSVLYDLRNFTEENFWGPFLGDGEASVDWERMEAIMVVLGYNLKMFSNNTQGKFKPLWREPWKGANSQSFSPISVVKDGIPAGPKIEADPYNISGTWMRVVCFLDFHELYHYNFSTPDPGPGVPRPPIETTEAIRLIVMEISVTSIKHAGEPDGPGPSDSPDFPVVYFDGMSRSMHQNWDPNANSKIRGRVSVTREGEVRWTTWSIYWGEERWKSEGIQIGGTGSGRGVLGHWFDKNLSDEGPAGPTAFWKVSNEIDEDRAAAEPNDDDDEEFDVDFVPTDDEDDEAVGGYHIHIPGTGTLVIISHQEEVEE